MSNAPVCPIQPKQTIDQPQPRVLPAVPVATDLVSALAAINAMRQIILILTGGTTLGGAPPLAGQSMIQAPSGTAPGGTTINNNYNTRLGQAPNIPASRYSEVPGSRVQETFRLVAINNPDFWIDFVRINRVAMVDNVTKETWLWQRS